MSEVANTLDDFFNFPSESEEGKPNCMKVLLKIDELITKSWIDSLKDIFGSERERCR